jgi:hypothetical protein
VGEKLLGTRFRKFALASGVANLLVVAGLVRVEPALVPTRDALARIGASVPTVAQPLVDLSEMHALVPLLVLAAIVVFVLAYRVARPNRVWLIFVPLGLNLAIAWALYLPAFALINAVK